jgi:hypothetical protein
MIGDDNAACLEFADRPEFISRVDRGTEDPIGRAAVGGKIDAVGTLAVFEAMSPFRMRAGSRRFATPRSTVAGALIGALASLGSSRNTPEKEVGRR